MSAKEHSFINWAQNHNYSLAAIANRVLSLNYIVKEKPQAELANLLYLIAASWADPYKEVPGIVAPSMG